MDSPMNFLYFAWFWARWSRKHGQEELVRSICGPEPSADHTFFALGKDLEGNDSYRISCLAL